MLMEWGSAEDPRVPGHKAQWIARAAALFQQPAYSQFTALLYWTHHGTPEGCHFTFRSSASATAAWRAMGSLPAYRGV